MNEFIEKLLGRLEECEKGPKVESLYNDGWKTACQVMKYVVNELAEEHSNGWIPTSERLPERDGVYLITLSDGLVYLTIQADFIYKHPHHNWWRSDSNNIWYKFFK